MKDPVSFWHHNIKSDQLKTNTSCLFIIIENQIIVVPNSEVKFYSVNACQEGKRFLDASFRAMRHGTFATRSLVQI